MKIQFEPFVKKNIFIKTSSSEFKIKKKKSKGRLIFIISYMYNTKIQGGNKLRSQIGC